MRPIIILYSMIFVVLSKEKLFRWPLFGKQLVQNIIEKGGGNTSCTKDLETLMANLYHHKPWAFQMIDATSKMHPGLLAGNIFQLGHYDECLAIEHTTSQGSLITGQYCSVVVNLKQNASSQFSFLFDFQSLMEYIGLKRHIHSANIAEHYNIVIGACFPRSCSIERLQSIWNYAETTTGLPVHIIFNDSLCTYKGKPLEEYNADYYIIALFLIIISIVLMSTVYDWFLQMGGNSEDSFLTIFSLYSNSRSLFSVTTTGTDLTCLNGIKVLSMLWILLGHRMLANAVRPNINSFYILDWKRHIESTIVSASMMAVDSFFTISGLLLTYTKLKFTEKNEINWFLFYLYRWIRLTPALLAVILLYISVLKWLGDGPFWGILATKAARSCYYNWWSTVLYLTNYVYPTHQCVEHSWYLAVDTQLYILSPLILANINKYPKKTFAVMTLIGLASCTYNFYMTVKYNYGSIVFDAKNEAYIDLYQPTYARVTPWLIGIYFGYYIYNARKAAPKIKQIVFYYVWPICSLILVGIILYHVTLALNTSRINSGLFNALSRPIWSLALCGLITSCATDYADTVNKFLSLPVFTVLGKLTYTTYLIHLAVLLVLNGSQKTAKEFTNLSNFHDFCGDLIIVFICSVVFCLVFESPIFALLRILKKKHQLKSEGKENVQIQAVRDAGLFKDYVFWIFALRAKPDDVKVD